MRHLAFVLALLTLALPAVAQAQSRLQTGGAIRLEQDGYGHPEDAFVVVADDEIHATAYVTCAGEPRELNGSGRIAPDGRIGVVRLVGSGRRTGKAGRVTATLRILGSVREDDADGSLRLEDPVVRRTGRATRRCRTTRLLWRTVAAETSVPGRASTLAPRTTFYGAASGPGLGLPIAPILFRTDGRGRISHALWTAVLPCADGTLDDQTYSIGREARLTATGRFEAHKTARQAVGGGQIVTERAYFAGHAAPGGLSGYLRVRRVYREDGEVVTTCDSGKLTWGAVPPPAGG